MAGGKDPARGNRIRALIGKSPLTRPHVAGLVGVSLSAVEKWEQGQSIDFENVVRLAQVLETTPLFILLNIDEELDDDAVRAAADKLREYRPPRNMTPSFRIDETLWQAFSVIAETEGLRPSALIYNVITSWCGERLRARRTCSEQRNSARAATSRRSPDTWAVNRETVPIKSCIFSSAPRSSPILLCASVLSDLLSPSKGRSGTITRLGDAVRRADTRPMQGGLAGVARLIIVERMDLALQVTLTALQKEFTRHSLSRPLVLPCSVTLTIGQALQRKRPEYSL